MYRYNPLRTRAALRVYNCSGTADLIPLDKLTQEQRDRVTWRCVVSPIYMNLAHFDSRAVNWMRPIASCELVVRDTMDRPTPNGTGSASSSNDNVSTCFDRKPARKFQTRHRAKCTHIDSQATGGTRMAPAFFIQETPSYFLTVRYSNAWPHVGRRA